MGRPVFVPGMARSAWVPLTPVEGADSVLSSLIAEAQNRVDDLTPNVRALLGRDGTPQQLTEAWRERHARDSAGVQAALESATNAEEHLQIPDIRSGRTGDNQIIQGSKEGI